MLDNQYSSTCPLIGDVEAATEQSSQVDMTREKLLNCTEVTATRKHSLQPIQGEPLLSSTVPSQSTNKTAFFSIDDSIRQMSILLSHPIFLQTTHTNTHSNTRIPQLFSNAQELSNYIDTHMDALLFDCDGVLYRDSHHIIPHAREALHYWIEEKKKTVLFVTNNAGQTRRDLHSKLTQLFHLPSSCSVQHMMTSGYSAAEYLLHLSATTARSFKYIHVVGEDALRKEFQEMGFILVGHTPSTCSSMTRDELVSYPFHEVERMDALVVGLDTSFNYRKLCIATGLLHRHPDAMFIATNEDAYDVVGKESLHYPGNGSIVSALECASQRKAINVGKPTRIFVDLLIKCHSLNPHRSMMVGDRLDTDVKFGLEGGMTSALVLTGCTDVCTLVQTIDQATDMVESRSLVPHLVFPHVGMMLPESAIAKVDENANA